MNRKADNSPEVMLGNEPANFRAAGQNPYFSKLIEAESNGCFEEYYREEKEKLEYRLGFSNAAEVAASARRDLQRLADAYTELKLKNQSKKKKSASSLFLYIAMFFIAAFFIYQNYLKNQTIAELNEQIRSKNTELSSTNDKLKTELLEIKNGKAKLH